MRRARVIVGMAVLSACSVAGCGAAGREGPAREGPARAVEQVAPGQGAGGASSAGEGGTAARREDARTLRSDARFGELVAAARRQDQLRDQDSTAGCLLRLRPAPRLEADLAAAVRPLPEPPASLADRRGSVSVLTRYGALGAPDAELGLVAFTTTRPAPGAGARVLSLRADGLWLASTDGGSARAIERDALAGLDDGRSLVVITAESGITVEALGSVLAALPSSLAGRVALAVALPEGTRLPAPAAPEGPDAAPVCELEPLPDAGWGELDAAALRRGVTPLVDRARLCVGTTEGPGALGGRVVLSMRIDPTGRVGAACVSEDSTDDGVLRACLVAAARELAFEAPTGGSVDVALPLRLEPGLAHRQTPLCP
jgi:hypothetical protein